MNRNMKRILVGSLFLILIFFARIHANEEEKVRLVYLFGNYDYQSLINERAKGMNVVSPSYFDIDTNGNIVTHNIQSSFIQMLHKNHMKVTPFLSNHWDREAGRAALNQIEKTVNTVISAIEKYHLDGINIDIENLTSEDKEAYIEFVKKLREKMPIGKTISVAVAANPTALAHSWQGSYDYTKLSEYADYLIVMAYDEHYEGGTPGAVSGTSFFQKSIEYAMSKVDASKIVIGVPFYGRYWQEGKNEGGYGVTIRKVEEIISKYNTNITYDEENGCVIACVTIQASDTKPKINGKTLSEGTYYFYYENEKSMQEKVKMIERYHVKGIAAWSLGQESEEIWNAFSQYFQKDTEKAEVMTSGFIEDDIQFVKEMGWMRGKGNGFFGEQDDLTRAEFATMIARIKEIEVTGKTEDCFHDVQNHWAKDAINVVSKTGLMIGYPDGNYRPNQSITREEVAKVISLLVDSKSEGKVIEFSDVKENTWSYRYIMKLVQSGIIHGYGDATFRPKNNITRKEMAILLKNAFDRK